MKSAVVCRICATYRLMPDALTPALQQQIRRGYDPFAGPTVKMVQDAREREQILAGPPACIIASSGMLTGGPSVWFAQRLAGRAEASILITGYQDEEAPGKRLLDLAEQKTGLLDLGGQQVPVACQVATYRLSAHADGGELAALAAALKPATVMLVHGDQEAREALQQRLVGMEVVLPADGSERVFAARRAKAARRQSDAVVAVEALPLGIGTGVPLEPGQVEQLWEVVSQLPDLETVTARHLALMWYGEATEETEQAVREALTQAADFFTPLAALPGAYQPQVRARQLPAQPVSAGTMLPGQIVLLRDAYGGLQAARAVGVERAARVAVQWPEGMRVRTHVPLLTILEVVGRFPSPAEMDGEQLAHDLAELLQRARQLRRRIRVGDLARRLEVERMYTLEELCGLADQPDDQLAERLAVAWAVARHPRLFTAQAPVWQQGQTARYGLHPAWREAVDDPAEVERPDQAWLLSVVERHLGTPPELYRRSVDPLTGQVTLAFHFPEVAHARYAEAIAAAAAEAEVEIAIAPQTHQGALAETAQRLLPAGLRLQKAPSVRLDQHELCLFCSGQASEALLREAEVRFAAETGWRLVYELEGEPALPLRPGEAPPARLEQNATVKMVRQALGPESGLYKIGIEVASGTLTLRFHFPLVAQRLYAEQLGALEQQTGWRLEIVPTSHQGALEEAARHLLPPGLELRGSLSLHHDEQQVVVIYTGTLEQAAQEAAQAAFLAKTGWKLLLRAQPVVVPPQAR